MSGPVSQASLLLYIHEIPHFMDNLLSILQTVVVTAMEDHIGEQKWKMWFYEFDLSHFLSKKAGKIKFAKSKDEKLVNYWKYFGQGSGGFGF